MPETKVSYLKSLKKKQSIEEFTTCKCPIMRRMSKTVGRLLAVFDFDHTIIDGNSDVVVKNLLPADKISEDVSQLYRSDGWTVYMRNIFRLLHECNFSKEEILKSVRNIPYTPGMDELLKWLKSVDSEVIIISDSNSVFIDDYLQNTAMENNVTKVFTNPAVFNESNCLEIEMYHFQDWCQLSTKNLCKGYILQSYIEERQKEGIYFSFVAYVGDGTNDFCPSLKLGNNDITFPRIGHPLEKKLMSAQKSGDKELKATVIPWNTGNDIINALKQRIESQNL